MEYVSIGSNGFAQVGDPDYYKKVKVELSILLDLISEKFPVPDAVANLCYVGTKKFYHDFGPYSEIVIFYNDQAIETDSMTEDQELTDIFWDWCNAIERFDLETVFITNLIKAKYTASLNLEKAEHLSVVNL